MAEGILSCAAITPIGVALQEPSMTCLPLVCALPGNCRQKLMKLFVDVSEGSFPSVALYGDQQSMPESRSNVLT